MLAWFVQENAHGYRHGYRLFQDYMMCHTQALHNASAKRPSYRIHELHHVVGAHDVRRKVAQIAHVMATTPA